MPAKTTHQVISSQNGVHELSALEFPYHADHHAGEDLDKAQAHGAHQNHQRVVQRREQGRQGERALRVDQLGQLGEEVAEETAGEGAHHKGADAAQAQQAEEVPHRSLRGGMSAVTKHGGQHHQQSVSHIRHHHAVEEDEKRRHEGVGVHIVIGRQGVHLRHHVQRPGQTSCSSAAPAPPDTLSGAGSAASQAQPRRSSRALTSAMRSAGAHPSKKTMVPSVSSRSAALSLSGLRCQPVRVGPQGVPLPGALRNGRLGLLPPALELLQLPVSLLQILAAAVPVTPGKAAALKPWARRTSITGSSAARWQRSSRYRCCLSALISSSSAGSAVQL